MRTGRNGYSPGHFFNQLRTLSVRTICNVSKLAECKILMEDIHCHLLLAFIHGTRGPAGKQLML